VWPFFSKKFSQRRRISAVSIGASKTCGRCGHVMDISGYLTLGNADGVAYGNVFLSGGH
jgi:hypothetical protein